MCRKVGKLLKSESRTKEIADKMDFAFCRRNGMFVSEKRTVALFEACKGVGKKGIMLKILCRKKGKTEKMSSRKREIRLA